MTTRNFSKNMKFWNSLLQLVVIILHITLIILDVSVTSCYLVRMIAIAVFCLCITNIIRSYHSQTKRKIIQCQNFDIEEQIFANSIVLGRVGLKIFLIWSCLLQDCKRVCPVITRPTDAGCLLVYRPLANNSYRSASFGVFYVYFQLRTAAFKRLLCDLG
jgi:hypothetical protein